MWFVVALRSLVRVRPVRPARGAPRPRRKARATVLAGLVAILAFQVGLFAAINTGRARWRDPEFFHRYQKLFAAMRWNQRGQTHHVVAVIGSSRPQMGFSPDHAAEGYGPGAPLIFSLCQTGCQPLGERLNLHRVMTGKLKPDFVLIEVMPSNLAANGPLDGQLPASRLSWADLECVTPYLTDPAAMRRAWWQAQKAPWATHRMSFLAHQGLEDFSPASQQQNFLWADMRPNGWSPYYPPPWPKEEHERRTNQALDWFRDPLANFWINPTVAAAHRDALAECRANGVRAALFVMPESPTFRTLYSTDARQLLREYLDGLAKEFGVPVFDASEWIADESLYMDGYHLLGPGAEAFSRRFGREALREWVPPSHTLEPAR